MRFTIKLKLGLAFGFMTLLLIGIAVYGSMSLGTLNDASGNIDRRPDAPSGIGADANVAEVNAIRAQKNALLAHRSRRCRPGSTRRPTRTCRQCSMPSMPATPIASPEGKPYWEKLQTIGAKFRDRSAELQQT